MKKVRLLLAVASSFVSVSLYAANFQDIQFWVGSGTNQAGLEIDWNDGTTNTAHIWGYRWNGNATGEEMLDAIVAADPRLYAEVSASTQFGTALFGFGLDHNADQVFPLNPALTFNINHLAISDYNSVNDNRTNVDAGDKWQEGWFSAGFWTYWLSDESRLSDDYTDWTFSGVGMTGRILANGNWDGWSFARGFNDSLPADPFPHAPVVDNNPHPTVRLVHGFNSTDGSGPAGTLLLQGNTLYGTANGGTNYNGVIFAVQTNGLGFATVHSFAGGNEGAYPYGALVSSNGILYGTTSGLGANGSGTLFSLGLDGSNFSTIYTFGATDANTGTNDDGAFPYCGLTIGSDGSLFGSANSGGQYANGSLFHVGTSGNAFTNIHSFTAPDMFGFNQDGAKPALEMISRGNVLYGVMPSAGAQGDGNIFKINADGSGFTALHDFSELNYTTNLDGAVPYGPLLLAGDVLYGTTFSGGPSGNGTIFSIHTDGSNFTNLYRFGTLDDNSANGDGANPIGGLVADGKTLYGVTQYGGKKGQGTLFQINTDGSGFYSLFSFPRLQSGTNALGANPGAGLIHVGSSFYGTTSGGGPTGNGTVFALDIPNPNLALSITNNQVSVTWPVWAPNYALEMLTDVSANHWQALTNELSGTNFVFQTIAQGNSTLFRLKK